MLCDGVHGRGIIPVSCFQNFVNYSVFHSFPQVLLSVTLTDLDNMNENLCFRSRDGEFSSRVNH